MVTDTVSKLLVQLVDVDDSRVKTAACHAGTIIGIGLHMIGIPGCRILPQNRVGNDDITSIFSRKIVKLPGHQFRRRRHANGISSYPNAAFDRTRGQFYPPYVALEFGLEAQSVDQVVQNGRLTARQVDASYFEVMTLS